MASGVWGHGRSRRWSAERKRRFKIIAHGRALLLSSPDAFDTACPSGTHTKGFGKDVHACWRPIPTPLAYGTSPSDKANDSTTKLHLQLVDIDFPSVRPSVTFFKSIFRSLRYIMRKLCLTKRLSILSALFAVSPAHR